MKGWCFPILPSDQLFLVCSTTESPSILCGAPLWLNRRQHVPWLTWYLGHPDWLICQPAETKEQGWLLCSLFYPQGNNLKSFSSTNIRGRYQLPEDLKELRPLSSPRFDWSCLIGVTDKQIKLFLFLTRFLRKKISSSSMFQSDSEEKITILQFFLNFFTPSLI